MASKPLTTEAIALTEKKMDMALDDIIRMSKKTHSKGKDSPKHPIKSQGFLSGIASQRGNKLQRFMDSRTSIRQGVAQRRSNFDGNQSSLTTNSANAPRRSIKSQGFLSGIASQRGNKLQRFMDSRTSIRQGVLAQRRSNFGGNQFPLTTNAAKRAVIMPIRNTAIGWSKARLVPSTARATAQRRGVNGVSAGKDTIAMPPKQRPQTLDALFANMKENRMMVMSSQRQALREDHRLTARRRGAGQQQRWVVRGGDVPDRRQNF